MSSSSSSSSSWSIETFCEEQRWNVADWTTFPISTQTFLRRLELSSLHPFCTKFADHWEEYYIPGIPRQGPLTSNVHDGPYEAFSTWFKAVVPPLAAMGELWLRLLASALAPLGIVLMLHLWLFPSQIMNNRERMAYRIHWICILTVASSVVLLTDTLYILEFGPHVGASSLTASTLLTVLLMTGRQQTRQQQTQQQQQTHQRYRRFTLTCTVGLVGLAAFLLYDPNDRLNNHYVTFGDPTDHVNIDEGLYYDTKNEFLHDIVTRYWSQSSSSSSTSTTTTTTTLPSSFSATITATTLPYEYPTSVATRWMPTGDARTGLPFLLHRTPTPTYTRVWLPVQSEENNDIDASSNNSNSNDDDDDDDDGIEEFVALDISFPMTGYDRTKPLYLVLHGLNGGSTEEYVQDFVHRQTSQPHDATVVVMVARGLMDTPVRGWHNFHGARWTDAHRAATVLRKAKSGAQSLIAVGYSMGAIILANMMIQAGKDAAVDAAISISGGLDMRQQQHFKRAQRLWQPILTKELRQTFLLGKWGERVRQKLSHDTFLYMLRATHITEIDESAVVHYNGFRDVVHYYRSMSALGDIPLDELMGKDPHNNTTMIAPQRKIQQLHKPLLVVHALDDPLITWRTVAANHGPMHPHNLTTRAGNGNLLLLLTRRGGHVGWPMGWVPQLHTWFWMNHVAASFGEAVHTANNEQKEFSATESNTDKASAEPS